ncbi:hypothetical protein RhiTH_000332 [Rhizoctonia solani]
MRPIPGGRASEPVELSRVLPPSSQLSRISFRAAAYGADTLSREEIQVYREIPREDRTIFMFDEILRMEEAPDIFQTRPQISLLNDYYA